MFSPLPGAYFLAIVPDLDIFPLLNLISGHTLYIVVTLLQFFPELVLEKIPVPVAGDLDKLAHRLRSTVEFPLIRTDHTLVLHTQWSLLNSRAFN